jgi:uncharacterized iron-regulated membrane protein
VRVWRTWWVQAHLYLGLTAGALLVVFGVTGSILVFFQEIDEWLNPALLTVDAPADGQNGYRPIGEILRAAEQAAPPGSRITQVYGATKRERVMAVYMEQPSKAWQRTFVDPYRARVTGVRSYGPDEWVPHYLMDAIFALHYQLFAGVTGRSSGSRSSCPRPPAALRNRLRRLMEMVRIRSVRNGRWNWRQPGIPRAG